MVRDFNAEAVEWGIPYPDSRGRRILEMISRTNLLSLNVGSTTTLSAQDIHKLYPM